MSRPGAALVLGLLWSCGSSPCPAPQVPAPMSVGRAHELDPAVLTGLAVSTTEIHGDCRPQPVEPTEGCPDQVACAQRRASLQVLVLAANESVPIGGGDCAGAFEVEALSPFATEVRASSDAGEVVVALAPGTYQLLVSLDGRCADCGTYGAGTPCVVEIVRDQVTVRDLVLDRSTR